MEIWYENEDGDTIDLINDANFVLISSTGMASLPDNLLSTIDTVKTEGNAVVYRRRASRQITMTHRFVDSVTSSRRTFVRTLDEGSTGKLRYRDSEFNLYMNVEVESCEVNNTEEFTTAVTTFVASFPYWLSMLGNSTISFRPNQSIQIENDSDVDLGMKITYRFGGQVNTPTITNQDGESISVQFFTGSSQDDNLAYFVNGDVVEIGTSVGDVYCKLTRNNVVYDIITYLTPDSFPIKLKRGNNTFTFSAQSGLSHISEIAIQYVKAYKAV